MGAGASTGNARYVSLGRRGPTARRPDFPRVELEHHVNELLVGELGVDPLVEKAYVHVLIAGTGTVTTIGPPLVD